MLPRMHFRVANSSRALDDNLLHLSSSAESEACCVCSISRHRTWQEETHELHISQRQTWKCSSTSTVAATAAAVSHSVGGELKLSWLSPRTMDVPSKRTSLLRGCFSKRLDFIRNLSKGVRVLPSCFQRFKFIFDHLTCTSRSASKTKYGEFPVVRPSVVVGSCTA